MNRIAEYLSLIANSSNQPDPLLPSRVGWLTELEAEEIIELLAGFEQLTGSALSASSSSNNDPTADKEPLKWGNQLSISIEPVLSSVKKQRSRLQATKQAGNLRGSIDRLYADAPSEVRAMFLEMLTQLGDFDSLSSFAQHLTTAPPEDSRALDQAFIPLFNPKLAYADALFPTLLDALQRPGLATAILDLANYLTRQKVLLAHPAVDRVELLTSLLGQLLERLNGLERQMLQQQEPEMAAQQVTEGLALGVALCDALGLVGNPEAIAKLNQARELQHRRIRIEALAALVRLEEASAKSELLAMAADPASRLRAVQYATELDLRDELDEKWCTEQALAEAELAAWLSEPMQFGLPPSSLQPFDERTLYWPGFDEPQQCFLFQFEYRLPGGVFANVGLAGPVTHAFLPDLRDLPPADLYSAFAGWQTDHDEIAEYSPESDVSQIQVVKSQLESALTAEKLEIDRWSSLGNFFGEWFFVGEATREGHRGVAAGNQHHQVWFPIEHSERPLTPEIAYAILKGRLLLENFNPGFRN